MLRHWPVNAILSCVVNGVAIPSAPPLVAGAPFGVGFVLDGGESAPPGRMQRLSLRGRRFARGLQNVAISYTAGYQIAGEPAWRRPRRPTASRRWLPTEIGRAMAALLTPAGAALTPVAANPGAGQYSVTNGVYTFAAADAGAALSLTYGYVPADLAVACLDWVAERYAYRSRIGQQSKSLGGQETMAFIVKKVPDFVASRLAALSARCDAMIEAIFDAGAVDGGAARAGGCSARCARSADSAKTIGRRTAGAFGRARGIHPILGRG